MLIRFCMLCAVMVSVMTGCATNYSVKTADFGAATTVSVDEKTHKPGEVFSVKPGDAFFSVRQYLAVERDEPFLIPDASFKIYYDDPQTPVTILTFSRGEKYRIIYEISGHKDCRYAMGDSAPTALAAPFACVGHDSRVKARLLRQDWATVFEMDSQKFSILPEVVNVRRARALTISNPETAIAFDVEYVASVNGALVFSIKDIDPPTRSVSKTTTVTFKDSDSTLVFRGLSFHVHSVDARHLVIALQ